MDKKLIDRINELAHKKKNEGLTEEEKAEQAQLRGGQQHLPALRVLKGRDGAGEQGPQRSAGPSDHRCTCAGTAAALVPGSGCAEADVPEMVLCSSGRL